MVNRTKYIIIVVVMIIIGIAIFLLINKDDNKQANNEYNDKLDISTITFEKCYGDIYIPSETTYLLSLSFKDTENDPNNLINANKIATLKFDLNSKDVKVDSFEFIKIDNRENYYYLNLNLMITENTNVKINKINIDNNSFNIGELTIHSPSREERIIIKSNVAVGTGFNEYFADIENIPEIEIVSFSLGEFDAFTNSKVFINDIEFKEKMIIKSNSESSFKILFGNTDNNLFNKYSVLYLSPRFTFIIENKEYTYYFPYCRYVENF